MGSWHLYDTDRSPFMANMTRVFDAADAHGIYVVFQPIPAYGELPDDIRAAVPLSSWWSFWWANSTYPGTDPSLQGLGIWQAFFKGYVGPMLRAFGSDPCILMLKFVNEPGGLPTDSLGTLARYYATMGGLARAAGFQGYLSYEGPGGGPGYAGLITSILHYAPNFGPAVYDIHYPSTSEVATEATSAASYGVKLWVGEVYASWVNSAYFTTFKQHNVAACINRWDEDGTYLVRWTGGWATAPTPGTLTSTATTISSLETQILGTAVFFR